MTDPLLIERITRSLAFMLRHQPETFDLELDPCGFAHIEEVVRALNERLGEPVDEEDVREAVSSGDRPRYEIQGDAIRALYGHSIAIEPGPSSKPPEFLHVAVPEHELERARSFGLRGGRRRFLHLGITREDALESGRRAARDYAVLVIRALDAWEEGISFYDRQSLWLAEEIPTHLIDVEGTYHDGTDPVPRFEGQRSGPPRDRDRDRDQRHGHGRGQGYGRGREGERHRGRGERPQGGGNERPAYAEERAGSAPRQETEPRREQRREILGAPVRGHQPLHQPEHRERDGRPREEHGGDGGGREGREGRGRRGRRGGRGRGRDRDQGEPRRAPQESPSMSSASSEAAPFDRGERPAPTAMAPESPRPSAPPRPPPARTSTERPFGLGLDTGEPREARRPAPAPRPPAPPPQEKPRPKSDGPGFGAGL